MRILKRVFDSRETEDFGYIQIILRDRSHSDRRVEHRRPHGADRDREERSQLGGLLYRAQKSTRPNGSQASGETVANIWMIGSKAFAKLCDEPLTKSQSESQPPKPSRSLSPPAAANTGEAQDALVLSPLFAKGFEHVSLALDSHAGRGKATPLPTLL